MALEKKKSTDKEIVKETMKLSQVESYLFQNEQDIGFHVNLKGLPEVIVTSMRTVIAEYDVLFNIVPPMGAEMERLGCSCAAPEYCFNIYQDGEYKEENIDVEIYEAVTVKKEDSHMITFKTMEKAEAACVLHKGFYKGFQKH
jgi:hypothetical protein